MRNWQRYQEEAATFFRGLGLNATVEAKVDGVRSRHSVDVYVQGSLYGIQFSWVVECKAWQGNVPKEKVLALAEIVEDVGADRGFLLSEVGFQSGAITQANRRNITLASLQDLREVVMPNVTEQILSRLNWRADRAKEEFYRRHYEGGKYLTDYLISSHWFYLDYLSVVFEQAAKEHYPIVYKFQSGSGGFELVAYNVDELISGIDSLISLAEKELSEEALIHA